MKDSFLVAWRALVRGHVLTLLLVATALAHAFLPALVRSDGTAAGWREMFVRAVPGATYLFIAVTVLACACGAFAQERERYRLALTVVRPVSAVGVACGRWLALCAVAAAALVFSGLLTVCRLSDAPHCLHHHAPQLPPLEACAQKAFADYMADPKTPQKVKEAPKAAVLSLLTNKELDRYDVARAGEKLAWPFAADLARPGRGVSVRVRFATQFEVRSPFEGSFTFGPYAAEVKHSTQTVLDIPLAPATNAVPTQAANAGTVELRFANTGKETVMLRPRRDIELLTPADAFAGNLVRALGEMFAVLAVVAAFGLFLSAAVSRPVALFTAFVALLVTLMAPSVVSQFPDEMDTKIGERLGLALSRFVCFLTGTVSETQPISDLATDRCIEWSALARTALVNIVVLPALFLGLSAVIVRRKPLATNG